ncbi:mechanosensitive ion channel family protein [Caldimonas tepidiphila]|uniref:mechanosensitive ion channel family protein n=1 Tax=Caldimonas tepidiphila TaxID=2315841 RepID=UPI000E5BDCF9|nr:mechanosensitive ion channel family protein [Caldimonas tepidiphila]
MKEGLRRAALALLLLLLLLAAGLVPVHGQAAPEASALPASEAGSSAASETASVTQQDQRLVRELLARLSRIEGLRGVRVQVNAGVATLHGEVPTEEDRQRAAKLARDVKGIVEVDDQLRLDTSLSVRLRPTLVRVRSLAQQAVGALPLFVLSVLLVWGMGWFGGWLGDRQVLRRLVGGHPFLVDLLRQTVRVAAVLLGLVIALELLDATALIGAVIGTAGVVGLALGFALRDVVENYLAGLLLSLRQPFAPNDHVVIDGHEGRVAALTTRSTTLITLDGNHLRLPNSAVFKGVILNYSRNPQRRFTFRIGIGGGEDLLRARRIGVDALRRLPGVLADPAPLALVMELAESSVTLEFSAWFDQREAGFFQLRSEAIRVVKGALDAGGVDLPEPTYRVQLSRGVAGSARPAPGPAPDGEGAEDLDALPVERAVERQVAQEQALSAGSNLLKSDAPRE